jgi:hypothetical protein
MHSTWLSTDDTVFLEAQIVHRLIHGFLDFFPIASPLNEFIDILFVNLVRHVLLDTMRS